LFSLRSSEWKFLYCSKGKRLHVNSNFCAVNTSFRYASNVILKIIIECRQAQPVVTTGPTQTRSASAIVYQPVTSVHSGLSFTMLIDNSVPVPPVPTVKVDFCSDVIKHLNDDMNRCSQPVKAMRNANQAEIDKATLTAVSCICSSHWGPVISMMLMNRIILMF